MKSWKKIDIGIKFFGFVDVRDNFVYFFLFFKVVLIGNI